MIDISVVMSLYNESENEVYDAINSILLQTYKNFEFIIIIDNPNNHKLIKVVEKYQKLDTRIKFYINEINLGLAKSLNEGIKKAKGKYIARMDGDDISFLDRLEKQYKYLENNKDIFLIGSMAEKINEKNKKIGSLRHPINYEKIKKTIKYKTCFIHPSIFFRKKIFDEIEGYRNFPCAQDYDFTIRIVDLGYKVENLNEKLIKYRISESSITGKKRLFQILLTEYIQKLSIERKREKGKDSFNELEIKKIEEIYKENNVEFLKINNIVLKYKEKKILFLLQIPWIYIKSKFYRKEINNRIKIFFSTFGRQ
ncbi:glycosyltransferase [uncultured Fusobacterium sp.]|uniref:glycosyltransferase n=1 Tax=uncultured Fusobacterium sp. TaxID=159267 RepID=UPI0025954C96|nr:glycosyltransferase [uncultured Fusobacterium sp.]